MARKKRRKKLTTTMMMTMMMMIMIIPLVIVGYSLPNFCLNKSYLGNSILQTSSRHGNMMIAVWSLQKGRRLIIRSDFLEVVH